MKCFAAFCLIVVLFCEICVCELFNSQQQGNLVFVTLYHASQTPPPVTALWMCLLAYTGNKQNFMIAISGVAPPVSSWVLNADTGTLTPQFHIVFDDKTPKTSVFLHAWVPKSPQW